MTHKQLDLPVHSDFWNADSRKKLVDLLSGDLDFHDQVSNYATHNFHAFPAKFPPQLPQKFIEGLTKPDDVVLDPMMGSGTTVIEALLAKRHAIGFDIDPLAILLSRVKVTSVDADEVKAQGRQIVGKAEAALKKPDSLIDKLNRRFDEKTREFVEYWFAPETQLELMALISVIEELTDSRLREFFQVVFSSIIITKSGGVSLAFDLAHTRLTELKLFYHEQERCCWVKR
jgi:hypothetical protein